MTSRSPRAALPPEPDAAPEPSPVALTLVAMVLAVVAGFVDAVGFLHVVAAFPANQSGNVAFLGLSIGGTSPAPGWAPPVAISAFMVGVAVGRWSSLRVGPRRGGATVLGLELVLLAALAIALAAVGEGERIGTTAARVAALAAAALAMGLQTDVIRAVAGVAVSTTYLTGAIARVGETIGTPPGSRERETARRLVLVLSMVLIAYVGGAALGASRLGDHTGFLVPAALVAGVLTFALARPWS